MGPIRSRLASATLLAGIAFLVGCGDDTPAVTGNGGTGGGAGTSAGGEGGSDVGGTGGSDVGGSGGGAGTGGAAGTGGTGGVAGTGGSAGTGGTAGSAGRGGTGGVAGTGVAGMDGGTDVAAPCYTVAFTKPTNNQTLTVADDKTNTCADGFQYDVVITTNAPAGTTVQLFSGATMLSAVSVANGGATFPVQLMSTGASTLQIEFPSRAACTDPSTRSNVNVTCPNTPPTCNITQPTISATHPALNGVQAPAGDRTSLPGSPYEATFVVTTSAEDGQQISLRITDTTSNAVTTVTAPVSGGQATRSVTLEPDGRTYSVVATCTNRNGIAGSSAIASFPVDFTPPTLTIASPTAGQFIGPPGTVQVCGQTTSADAAGLPASLGAAQNNLCVALAGSASCIGTVAVTAVNTNACVAVACPGAAPFDINVTLTDAAGNPTTRGVQGITCASMLPSVQIITPVSDSPTFNDPAFHILSATAPVGVRDTQPAVAGAQANIVACTNNGGQAALFVGRRGDASLSQLGSAVTPVAAVPADNCPNGLGFVIRFSNVTLPQSTENADGTLLQPTEIQVSVTDSGNPQVIGRSAPLDLWVDTNPPAISLMAPVGLCGSFQQASTTLTQTVSFTADDRLVVLQVVNGASTDTYDAPTFSAGVATFTGVVFDQGQNDMSVAIADPAGNITNMTPDPCTVTIGSAPVVTFNTPTSANGLCPVGATSPGCIADADGTTAGWQGAVSVHVTGGGQPITSGTVTFTIGATTLGVATLDGSGNAMLSNVTIAEGTVTIVATTSNIPNRGVGTGSVTLVADLAGPAVVTNLMATVSNRRATSMLLTWTAPADAGGGDVTSYQVRYARVPITSANFDDAAVTTAVTYMGNPSTAGQPDQAPVNGLYIETDYYFAVAAVDGAGNESPPTPTTTATRAEFLTTVLTGAAGDRLGRDMDSGDFGRPAGLTFAPDGFSDLLIGGQGSTRHVLIYFGSASGYSATPSITITGTVGNFGSAVANAGDIDGDGLDDIAVASRLDGNGKVFIFSRKSPPASWGTTNAWPANLTDAQANYVISADTTLTLGAMDIRNLARLGNFDGSGFDDLAISFDGANALLGAIFIVKGSSSFASVTIPNTAAAIRIDGSVAGGVFGAANLGLGPFFQSSGGGPGLITSAVNASAVYAFAGQAPAGAISASSANDSATAALADRYGTTLGLLGPLGVSPAAISIGSPVAAGGYLDVHIGTAATGPILGVPTGTPSASVRFVATGNGFGGVNIGGGIRGTAQVASVVGNDAVGDLVIAGNAEAGMPIYIVDGARLSSMSGTVNVSSPPASLSPFILRVPGKLPSGWANASLGALVPDCNGDGHGDFAIAESVGAALAGRVVVFY